MDVIKDLPVNQTVWRPEGNNGKSEYTQDSLHSVWFSVPNEYIEKYGDMYAVHAMWLDAVLKPALMTGNDKAYNAILPYLGKNIDGHTDDIPYAYLGAESNITTGGTIKKCEISYNAYEDMRFHPLIDGWGVSAGLESKNPLDALFLLFPTNGASADLSSVRSNDIVAQMRLLSERLGGTLINGKYSASLFSSVASEWSNVNYTADDMWDQKLTSCVIDKNWWQKHFGLQSDNVTQSGFEGVRAVEKVETNDLIGSISEVANRLYVSQNDYSDLMNDYAKAQNENKTLYLYRYQVSDYISYEATLWEENSTLGIDNWDKVDTNGYFFSETVNLDFDVIDLTFKKGEVKTVIPVVMSPIDIFSESTPPIDTTEDDPSWWKDFFAGIGGGGSQNDGESDWAKAKKILFWVMIGAVVAIVVTVVIVVIVKIRNGHIRSETYKNTRPRKKSYSRSYRKRRR